MVGKIKMISDKSRELILWLAPEPPTLYSGGSISLTHCFRQLSKTYDIEVFCFHSNLLKEVEKIAALPENVKIRLFNRDHENKALALMESWSGNLPYKTARNKSGEMKQAIENISKECNIAAVFVEHGYMVHLAWNLNVPKIINMQNIESGLAKREMLHERSGFRKVLWKREEICWIGWEKRMVEAFDHVTVITDEDRAELVAKTAKKHAGKISVLERGTECHMQQEGKEVAGNSILFVGSMAYGPNIDAVNYFSRNIFPRIRKRLGTATFTIVGANPASKVRELSKLPGIMVTGFVEDVEPYYNQSSMVVIPMRSGGGVKMKFLEALGRGMPVVVTSAGAAGVKITNNKEAMIADNDVDFAEACIKVLADKALICSLGHNAYNFAKKHHSWEATGAKLVGVVDSAKQKFRRRNAGIAM